ncbi:hypothetical protein [Actinacidiphila paucisporea]|uniref:hypothetical protein n=1 Tax=Actinacidiphila paucisporea TaxID=310782 RepID=UPI000935E5C5|nr:hypothetical protein [Actinacidiphila paucisporea]
MLLAPEKTLFVRGATPLLLLADAPVHDVLPLLAAPGETVPLCEGWGIAPRLTLCVVDGPGDHGVLIPALAAPVLDVTDGPGRMADWCADAEGAGGAVALSMDRLPDVIDWSALLAPGTARGGFLPALARPRPADPRRRDTAWPGH